MWFDVCIMKKKVIEAASLIFEKKTLYAQRSHENERFACMKASQMAKKWMRLKMFQHTQNHRKTHVVDQLRMIGHMLIVWAWMLVNELH